MRYEEPHSRHQADHDVGLLVLGVLILSQLTVRGVHVLSWTAMFALCIELRSFPVIRGID